jgi:hypothetical protein
MTYPFLCLKQIMKRTDATLLTVSKMVSYGFEDKLSHILMSGDETDGKETEANSARESCGEP